MNASAFTALFNPHLMPVELLSDFVIRQELLDELKRQVVQQPITGALQHLLLIGRRGMGKTSLLLLLAHVIQTDPSLNQIWFPVRFPEEIYRIGDLADFWLEVFSQLGHETGHPEWSALAEKLRVEENNTYLASLVLEQILKACGQLQRRLVLLLDNIDQILEHISDEREQHALRKILMETPQLLLVGTSCAPFEATYRYDAAFYDFFRVYRLENLSDERIKAFLAWKSGQDPAFIHNLEADPGRLKALTQLTGGSPRLLQMIYQIFEERPAGEIHTDLELILDRVTPLYKDRIESLPVQMRQIFDVLASHWEPLTTAVIAQKTRLSTTQTSSQIKRLIKLGEVTAVSVGKKRQAYMVTERFYNIYYLMRFNRQARKRLHWFISFVRLLFNSQQIQAWTQSLSQDIAGTQRPYHDKRAQFDYLLAMAEAMPEIPLQQELYTQILDTAIGCDLPGILSEAEFAEIGKTLGNKADRKRLVLKTKELIFTRISQAQDWEPEVFWEVLSGHPIFSWEQKEVIAKECQRLSTTDFSSLKKNLVLQSQDTKCFLGEKAFKEIQKLIKKGDLNGLPSFQDVDFLWSHASPGSSLWLLILFALPDSNFFNNKPQKNENIKLIELVQKEIEEINPPNFIYWAKLGGLSAHFFRDYKNAEKFYKKSLNFINKKDTPDLFNLFIGYFWDSYANYCSALRQSENALKAFQKATEYAPQLGHIWKNKGLFLVQMKKMNEASQAFQKAMELNPDDYDLLIKQSLILIENEGRFKEAIQLLRRVISDSPHKEEQARAWNTLALIHETQGEFPEAELALKQAFNLTELTSDTSLHNQLFLCFILLQQKKQGEAWDLIQGLLEKKDVDYFSKVWVDLLDLILILAQEGYAPLILAQLEKTELGEQWFPLKYALEAQVKGLECLLALAPEVRKTSEELLKRMGLL